MKLVDEGSFLSENLNFCTEGQTKEIFYCESTVNINSLATFIQSSLTFKV